MTNGTRETAPAAPSPAARAAGVAVRNGMIVGISLVATWTVGLIVRLVLPRSLGPDLFGKYTFAEALAINGMAFVGLGLDTYVQKEIPRRPEHASDFFGGTQLVRVVGSVIVLGAMAALTIEGGHSREVLITVIVFGLAQLCVVLASTCAALLYSVRRVGRMSALNIAAKLLWAAAVSVALFEHAPIWAYAAASLASESLRLVVLLPLAKEALPFRIRLDLGQTASVLRKSAPFYVAGVGVVLYSKIDVGIMGMLVPDREVGYYGAATSISAIAMLMAPLVGRVLTPELARAAARPDELMALLRRSIEWVGILAVPVSMALGLGAHLVVHTVFGAGFDPAIGAMRALSPVFLLVYVAMLGSTGLILLNRSWIVTWVTLGSLVANAAINLVVLRPALRAFGAGGAGIGASLATVATEAGVALTYAILLGRDVVDRRSASALAWCLGACGAVMVVHVLSRPLGDMRLALDAVVYCVLVLGTGSVRVSEIVVLFRSAWKQRSRDANP